MTRLCLRRCCRIRLNGALGAVLLLMYVSNPPFHLIPTCLSVRFQPAFSFDSNPPFHKLFSTRLFIFFSTRLSVCFPVHLTTMAYMELAAAMGRDWSRFGMKKFTYLQDKHTEMYL
ncbi:hypothetical protein K435DRAFT_974843, partial [Dendrothele bispora CBS 962.96]